ncbi:MAG: hypothetical protein ACI9W4_002221 [Rhodothermales bacterium]
MNVEDNIKEAGHRLGRDMRAIRVAHSVTHESICRETKAAANVLEEFERTALVGNPMYNRVYLRLFMRSYAEVIGIRSDDVLHAADEMLQGQYTDRLARIYLESDGTPEKAVTPTETKAPAAEGKADVPPIAKPGSPRATKKDAPPPQSPASKPPRPTPRPPVQSGARSTASGTTLSKGAIGGIAGFVLALLIAAAIWYFWPDPVETTPAVIEQPATEGIRIPEPQPQLPPRMVLGDTTSFFVIAARDTLNPIRITADRGIRTPYWIQLGDSLEFRVADELVLERLLNAVDVSVYDVLLPTNGRDATRRLVITRAFAQAYLDSLRIEAGAAAAGAAVAGAAVVRAVGTAAANE